MYGRFRVVRDTTTGADIIRTHDGRTLASTADVSNPRPPAPVAPQRPLSLADFVRAITDTVRVQAAR
jgi:hypothetical protein